MPVVKHAFQTNDPSVDVCYVMMYNTLFTEHVSMLYVRQTSRGFLSSSNVNDVFKRAWGKQDTPTWSAKYEQAMEPYRDTVRDQHRA